MKNGNNMTNSDKNIWTIRYFFLCFLIIGLNSQSYGQKEMESPQLTQSVDPDTSEQENGPGFGAFPVIFYSDQTRLAGGGGAKIVFGGPSEHQSSSIGVVAFYTQNKQYVFQIGSEIYLKGGTYKFSGEMAYLYFPDTFYGIGNNTSKEYEDFTSRLFAIKPSLQKKVYSNLYMGFQYGYYSAKLSDIKEGEQLATENVSGSEGGMVSGTGINATWDSRNNNLYPTSGSYHQFMAVSYGSSQGSDYTFKSYLLDLRHYRSISSEHILAFRGVIGLNTGDPPLQLMNSLGAYLRGYQIPRFIDKDLIAFQAEYRRPFVWKLGIVAFGGFGQVASKVDKLSLKELKHSIGFGIRFPLIPEQKVNLRIDFGIGKDDSSFDINIMEVF